MNKELIKSFKSKKNNNSLEDYLLDERKAWAEDSFGETTVYLIKDKAGNIACYFSIRCALVVGDDSYEALTEDERDIIAAFVDARKEGNKEAEENCVEAIRVAFPERDDYLIELALNKVDRKSEAKKIGQSENTMNVYSCYSALEIRHFCKNENYELYDLQVPLGFGLFWEKIVPFVLGISDMVGCKYLYLFAADKTQDENDEIKKLVRYYKNDLSFHECDLGIRIIKPDYDQFCYGLMQEIYSLKEKREAIWEQFSDVLEPDQ